jgi:hypothetical protein
MKRFYLVPVLTLLLATRSGRCVADDEPRAGLFDPPVRLKAGDEYIDTGNYIGHAGPLAADLDADGKLDLLVGTFSGNFLVYMNVGSSSEPVFADKGLLEAEGTTVKVPNW